MTLLYILLGIGVNFIWGLAFFIPYYLKDVNPAVIALGRYLVYGVFSTILIFFKLKNGLHVSIEDWKKAFLFAFAGNVGYYLFLTISISLGGIAIAALIVGTLPITMAFYGNIIRREFKFINLLPAAVLILTGLIILKTSQIWSASTDKEMLYLIGGGFFALLSLFLWTWYGVSNASYLKENPSISGDTWSLLIGVCCFIQSLLGLPILFICSKDILFAALFKDYIWIKFIIACFALGIIVSWLGTVYWNKVSRNLPVTITGQLIVFETISSLLYGYIADQKVPELIELLCIILIITGVILGIRSITAAKGHNS